MKPLSETLTELGIAFSFPIQIKDAKGYETYYENSRDYWCRCEYDANGRPTYYEDSNDYWERCERDDKGEETYYEDSDGLKRGTPKSSKTCEGKVIEVDGLGGIRSSMCLDSNSTLELMQKSTQSTMKNTLKPLPSFLGEESTVNTPKTNKGKDMTDNINEPSLTDIILDLKEDFIYLRNENLRLQEENNQLKQAIAALNGDPTNSL